MNTTPSLQENSWRERFYDQFVYHATSEQIDIEHGIVHGDPETILAFIHQVELEARRKEREKLSYQIELQPLREPEKEMVLELLQALDTAGDNQETGKG